MRLTKMLFSLAIASAAFLGSCSSYERMSSQSPPQSGRDLIARLKEIAKNGWAEDPGQVARVLGAEFKAVASMTSRLSGCDGLAATPDYQSQSDFWFQRKVPPGADTTVLPGSLQARFIPRDPKFLYYTYLTKKCRLQGNIYLMNVDSWMCVSESDVVAAGLSRSFPQDDFSPHYLFDGIDAAHKSASLVSVAFHRRCATEIYVLPNSANIDM